MGTKQGTAKITVIISEAQKAMLEKLSNASMKSQSVLIREALNMLFKSPGGRENV